MKSSSPQLSTLIDHIERFVKLRDEDKLLLNDSLAIRHVLKKEHILAGGEVCTANFFVLKGCFRMYFVNEEGQEKTIHFALDNWWITDFISLERQTASRFYIQAIEDSWVTMLTNKNQEILFDRIPKLERYFRLILQKTSGGSLQRLVYLFELSVEERYHHFNNSYPEFVQRIPQYMLASYLGFTPEVLSKIRAKK